MKILLIGKKWIGGWLEGVERAINNLGFTIMTFHYDTPLASNIARNRTRHVLI
jgi:hypothetical protein